MVHNVFPDCHTEAILRLNESWCYGVSRDMYIRSRDCNNAKQDGGPRKKCMGSNDLTSININGSVSL